MGAKLRRFPEYDVTLIVFSGSVNVDDAVDLFTSLDRRDRDCRITYFSEDTEPSGLIADQPRLKRIAAEKQSELPGGRHAFVCPSTATKIREYLDFVQRYSAAGDVHPTIPRVFSSLKAACDWLGLPEGACDALTEAANRASLEARRRREDAAPQPGGSPGQTPH